MDLRPGVRLGPYEIVSPLGAGGMGEVYRATDSRLQRSVAIKVLPSALSSDPERLKRFEREARSASALNHPNIVTIYDVGTEQSSSYIAMELVEGKTLRDFLNDAALPIRKVLEIGAQVAGGLARAHEAGIVHRDLKPENIMLRSDGFVKILDFGLAKLTRPETTAGQSAMPTLSMPTEPGVVMGTVGYMSPEQASGKPTDFRSDQFALGAILYEMATGRRAFYRATAPETLAAIIREEPEPIEKINPEIPAPFKWIVERCLAKDSTERYSSTEDLAHELRVLPGRLSEVTSGGRAAALPSARRKLRGLFLAAGLTLIAAAAGWLLRGAPGSRPGVPTFRQVTFRRATVLHGAFGPDHKTILYSVFDGKRAEVHIVSPGSRESRPLGVYGGLRSISSSGEIALIQDGTLSVASIGGGAARPLLEHIVGADWAPDGQSMALIRDVAGKERLEYPAGHVIYETSVQLHGVRVSPAGEAVVSRESSHIVVFDRSGRKLDLARDAQEYAWAPSGKEVLFTRIDGGVTNLYAVGLNGRERLVISLPGDFTLFDIAPDGSCLFERGGDKIDVVGRGPGDEHDRDLRWLDATLPAALSPDGRTLLFSEKDPAWQTATAYVRKMDGSPAVEIGPGFAKYLSPDGKFAVVMPSSSAKSLIVLPTGAGESRTLSSGDLDPFGATFGEIGGGFLPDGKGIVFCGQARGAKPRIYVQNIPAGLPRAISDEGVVMPPGCTPSPRGDNVLGFEDDEYRIYPVSGGKGARIPGLTKGDSPIGWSADGNGLYIVHNGDSPIRVSLLNVTTGSRKLWKEIAHPAPGDASSLFSIIMTPDGQSYVLTYSRWLSDLFILEGLSY